MADIDPTKSMTADDIAEFKQIDKDVREEQAKKDLQSSNDSFGFHPFFGWDGDWGFHD